MTDLETLSFACKACGDDTEPALEFEIAECPGRIDAPMCRACWRLVDQAVREVRAYLRLRRAIPERIQRLAEFRAEVVAKL